MRNASKLIHLGRFFHVSEQIWRVQLLQNQVRRLGFQKIHSSPSFPASNNAGLGLCFPSDVYRIINRGNRYFSSELATEEKGIDHVSLIEICSKASTFDEIKKELQLLDLLLTHETILLMLQNLDGSPEVALSFFDWVSETENAKLSSKSYNFMLGILGRKEHVKEFWTLVESMKKKGYGISRNTYLRVSETFKKEEMSSDLDKLNAIFFAKSVEDSVKGAYSRICKVIRELEWGEEVQEKLENLNLSLSSELVAMVLKQLSVQPKKALMFFRWIEGNRSFKNDAHTYNMMAQVLAREDCIGEFWAVVNEMNNAGFDMDMETCVKVFAKFYKRRMVKEAVDLYEFMMSGSNNLPVQDCVFLLRKSVAGKDSNMELFSRVVGIFTSGGNILTKTIFDSAMKSLAGAGKLGECGKILELMEEGGFVPDSSTHNQVVLGLCKAGKLDEAVEFLDNLEKSGRVKDSKLWLSLIEELCAAGEEDKALFWFNGMVEKHGVADVSGVFQILVNGFCIKDRPQDACRFLIELVNKKELRPRHATYKIIIECLLHQGSLKEAMSLLGLMKNHGFPPFLDPFIVYIEKCGSGEDALSFLKAMTVKKFPSTSVFIRIFEALLKAGRHTVAHDLFSKSPGYIRGHADVLELFCAMNPKEEPLAVMS